MIYLNSINFPLFTSCYACKYCKNLGKETCDNCEYSGCVDCINEHKKFEALLNAFPEKVDSALKEAETKTSSFDDELREKDIYVSWTSDIYSYLENMKDKKSEIQNEYSNWNIDEIKNEYEINFKKTRFKLEEDKCKLEHCFYERKKEMENNLEYKKNYHSSNMNSKREEKRILQTKLNATKNENEDKKITIINSFKAQLKSDAENNFIQQKNGIDNNPNYQKQEKKLEYSEGEKKEIEKYFNEINKINEYSKIVPQELIDNLLN